MTEIKSVPQALRDAAAIYEERNKLYGDNYKRHGQVMAAMFPTGVELHDLHDHNRFGVFTQIVAKLTRYAENFQRGGHVDSLDDMTVYSQMLQELDSEERLAMEEGLKADGAEVVDGVYTFPDHAIIPQTPAVFDDSSLAQGAIVHAPADGEDVVQSPELPIEDPVKAAPPTVL